MIWLHYQNVNTPKVVETVGELTIQFNLNNCLFAQIVVNYICRIVYVNIVGTTEVDLY